MDAITKLLIEKTDKAIEDGTLTIKELTKQANKFPDSFAATYLKRLEK